MFYLDLDVNIVGNEKTIVHVTVVHNQRKNHHPKQENNAHNLMIEDQKMSQGIRGRFYSPYLSYWVGYQDQYNQFIKNEVFACYADNGINLIEL